mgnify:CR=1 FL=1
MRLVCIDIGNTSATLGLYEDGEISRVTHINGGIRKNPEACSDMVRLIAEGGVEGVSIASVVPEVNSKWRPNNTFFFIGLSSFSIFLIV